MYDDERRTTRLISVAHPPSLLPAPSASARALPAMGSSAPSPPDDSGALTPEQVARFRSDGFLVVPDFATPAEIASLTSRATALVDAFDPASTPRSVFSTTDQKRTSDAYFLDSGNHVSFFFEDGAFDPATGALRRDKSLSINKMGHALHDLDPAFRAFSRGAKMRALMRSLGVHRPTPVQSMYIFKQPQIGGEVVPHQDSTFLRTRPMTCVGAWIALEACTKTNGCLWALPRSHGEGCARQMVVDRAKGTGKGQEAGDEEGSGGATIGFEGSYPDWLAGPRGDAFVPIECPAGTLVVLHGENVHYSAPNLSEKSRHAYSVHFVDGGAAWDERNWLQRDETFPFRALEEGEGGGGEGAGGDAADATTARN